MISIFPGAMMLEEKNKPMHDFYLAHPLQLRHEVRAWELMIEKKTGVDILNPFYDVYREEILKIDAGIAETYDSTFNHFNIVETDLSHLVICRNVLVILREALSIGTHCEMWDSVKCGRPVHIITDTFHNHPWVKYSAEKTNGFIFKTWGDFKQYLLTSFKRGKN